MTTPTGYRAIYSIRTGQRIGWYREGHPATDRVANRLANSLVWALS
jgi:hypothetical protein